jgi:endonuclease/exonuclease/phosphatase family metal-dependent hydrolase
VPAGGGSLRVVTWNVWDLRGDVAAVARVLRALEPDVVCLQEVPRRLNAPRRIARLAAATGLRLGAVGRGSGGTGILLGPRAERLAGWTFRLPVPPLARRRGAALCLVRVDGLELAVASVHLPLTPARRLAHASAVRRVVASAALPAIVAGDLNEPPGSPSWQVLGEIVADRTPDAPPTFPAGDPQTRLDAVLVGPGLRVLRHGPDYTLDREVRREVLAASDHHPVLAVIAVDR